MTIIDILDREKFRDLVELSANHFNMPSSFVEKDFWLCLVLRNVPKATDSERVVFKGGTSLSKAHDAIMRFSEDIDLALLPPDNKKDWGNDDQNISLTFATNLLKNIVPKDLTPETEDNDNKKYSKLLKQVYRFPHSQTYNDGAHDKIVIDVISFSSPVPHRTMTIEPYILQYINASGNDGMKAYSDINDDYLGAFEINVLDIRRTFIEKIFAICKDVNKYDKEGDHKAFAKRIRHVYDTVKIYENSDIKDFIKDSNALSDIMKKSLDDEWHKSLKGLSVHDGVSMLRSTSVFKDPNSLFGVTAINSAYKQLDVLLIKGEELPTLETVIATMSSIDDVLGRI